MALHMRMRAAGSSCVICFTASMPPISGMMMSIVTRSGLNCWYFSTACLPFSASPTTVNPAWDRMSLTIVRMKTASSQTSTVLLTLPPLSDDFLNYRLYVEHDHSLSFNLHHARDDSSSQRTRGATSHELIYRDVVEVADVVHTNPDQSLEIINQQNQTVRARARCLAKGGATV